MTDEDEELWELFSFLKGGKHRYDVFVFLAREGAAIPSEVAEQTGKTPQRVYDAQSELEEKGVIELKAPADAKKGRVRALTERGARLWEFMVAEGLESEQANGLDRDGRVP